LPTITPTPSPTPALLRNENRPGFYIRYYKPFEPVDPARWTLSVQGLVKKPQELTLPDVQSLPLVSQVSRMKCVECWSAAAKWEGFHLRSLMEIVDPLTEAKWLHFYCADDYYESLGLEELLMERVLFVHRMNDQTLPDVYGAPLRLIVPFKYGYKGPKAIVRLVFAERELPGYWPTVGPTARKGTSGRVRIIPSIWANAARLPEVRSGTLMASNPRMSKHARLKHRAERAKPLLEAEFEPTGLCSFSVEI
jgi:DMSO/TMAO reductase YedYZ molybdopterin-dependent catalytic subunit